MGVILTTYVHRDDPPSGRRSCLLTIGRLLEIKGLVVGNDIFDGPVEIRRENQLRLVVYSINYRVFVHSRW